MNAKKLMTYLAIAFVAFYILSAPEGSAELVRSGVSNLGDAADQVAEFVNRLVA